MEMRRKDREVTDARKIDAVIADSFCCRLAFCDGGRPYIVPLSFGFAWEGGRRVFYFHGAKEGRKIDLIRAGGTVGFELDTHVKLHEAEKACGYSAAFQSVIGTGRVSFVEGLEEKRAALSCIMAHFTGRDDWDFPAQAVEETCVFRLEVEELSCKEHL